MLSSVMTHPRFTDEIEKRCSDTVTIQVVTETQGESGEPVETWANLAGHICLPCMVGPAGGGEARTMALTLGTEIKQILIVDYYPAIIQKHRAVVNGVSYDILLAETDQGEGFTRLTVKRVT